MQKLSRTIVLTVPCAVLFAGLGAEIPYALRVGVAGHAFDHLGNIGEQAEAAAACGATIIYATGFGASGYTGLGTAEELAQGRENIRAYLHLARRKGIRLAIGYICATSIVKLETFDRNWSGDFRAQFSSPPSQWLQKDREGKPLPSWYGGDYRPACMNNPDWRKYQKFIVRLQLESDHDGVFFDNPTVHPQGCYCEHCMAKFAGFLSSAGVKLRIPDTDSPSFLRQVAVTRTNDFLRFRTTIARDFFAEIRAYARRINPRAVVTCNNSLNAPSVFFSQARSHGYNIYELSKAEDWVVVEDMTTQPRILADGKVVEYGPTYELLHAISHGKPVVACTIADADYHTPPNLVRLAMAEAAAHNASYLCWPTWPELERKRMAETILPQARLLRENEKVLNQASPRRDVILFLPFRRWLETDKCAALDLAAKLSQANIQFEVICEDDFELKNLSPHNAVVLIESMSVLNEAEKRVIRKLKNAGRYVIAADEEQNFCAEIKGMGKASLELGAPATVRGTVHDQPQRTIVHLLNLNIQKQSSFQDRVQPAEDLGITCHVPLKAVRSVRALTADGNATSGILEFSTQRRGNYTLVETRLPRLEISTILLFEK